MADLLTPDVSDRICKHMNEDHSEAIVLYAKVFGDIPEAEAAKLTRIDQEGMNLEVQIKEETVPVRITFDHFLKDSEDAHHTLIEMVKKARSSAKS